MELFQFCLLWSKATPDTSWQSPNSCFSPYDSYLVLGLYSTHLYQHWVRSVPGLCTSLLSEFSLHQPSRESSQNEIVWVLRYLVCIKFSCFSWEPFVCLEEPHVFLRSSFGMVSGWGADGYRHHSVQSLSPSAQQKGSQGKKSPEFWKCSISISEISGKCWDTWTEVVQSFWFLKTLLMIFKGFFSCC